MLANLACFRNYFHIWSVLHVPCNLNKKQESYVRRNENSKDNQKNIKKLEKVLDIFSK